MAKFIITVDSSCDCDLIELKQKNIDVIYFSYQDDKNVYKDTMDINGYKKFYDDVRGGKVYKTSQINPQEYYDFFKNLLKENLPIIHVSLGSGLSNTINSIFIAISMLKEEYENVDIRPIDSKIASLGLMLLINKLVKYRDNNISVDEAYIKTQEVVDNVIAYYTTDTLTYFARGGRLSKVEAFFGNTFKINPILDCDKDGKLRVTDKVRGDKKALQKIIDKTKDNVIEPEKQQVLICHADASEKAEALGKKLVEEVGFSSYKSYFMGPIIGAHTGPGLVAIFFFGQKRT